jgi:hypothetical protein
MKDVKQRELALPLLVIFSFLLCMSPDEQSSTVFAADVVPAPPAVPDKRDNSPSQTPGLPTPPPQQRPSIDPGIAIPPPTEPHPESVVTPPPIDPKMSIHPQDAPTSKQPSFPSPPSSPSPNATPPK